MVNFCLRNGWFCHELVAQILHVRFAGTLFFFGETCDVSSSPFKKGLVQQLKLQFSGCVVRMCFNHVFSTSFGWLRSSWKVLHQSVILVLCYGRKEHLQMRLNWRYNMSCCKASCARAKISNLAGNLRTKLVKSFGLMLLPSSSLLSWFFLPSLFPYQITRLLHDMIP